jgi:hypothetical protein
LKNADIERGEHQQTPPVRPLWHLARHQKQQQSGGQHPDQRGSKRPVRRQEF